MCTEAVGAPGHQVGHLCTNTCAQVNRLFDQPPREEAAGVLGGNQGTGTGGKGVEADGKPHIYP